MKNDLIINYLKSKIPDLKAVYGFGSRFDGRANEESDWDLAFLAEGITDRLVSWEWTSDLAVLLETEKIDLIDLRHAPIVFRFEILTTAQRIYCTDEYFCDLYECAAYTEYQFFNEQTEDLARSWVENYLKRKMAA